MWERLSLVVSLFVECKGSGCRWKSTTNAFVGPRALVGRALMGLALMGRALVGLPGRLGAGPLWAWP